jgi:hypothetical protein
MFPGIVERIEKEGYFFVKKVHDIKVLFGILAEMYS